jgi:hypothetical protein
MPAAGSSPGQLYDGALNATVTVPANALSIDFHAMVAGCGATGPTVGRVFTGTYDAHAGLATAKTNQIFTMTASGCAVTSWRVASASFSISPILDLQW